MSVVACLVLVKSHFSGMTRKFLSIHIFLSWSSARLVNRMAPFESRSRIHKQVDVQKANRDDLLHASGCGFEHRATNMQPAARACITRSASPAREAVEDLKVMSLGSTA